MAYAEINSLLMQSNIEFSAAEAHGMATGMLCANQHAQSESWLKELLSNDTSLAPQHATLLSKFFIIIQQTLASEEFAFNLFLPADDTALTDQADALKYWCQGFLFGVSLAGKTALNTLKEGRDIIRDITEFTKLDSQEVSGEDNELAFMEITEYLRAAVILLRDELASTYTDTVH
jgi:uncharacterized protein